MSKRKKILIKLEGLQRIMLKENRPIAAKICKETIDYINNQKELKVEYFKYDISKRNNEGKYPLVKIGEAKFHQFGVDYEEFENGPGNYTTAIIELEDGTVLSVPANLIRFLDSNKGEN